MPRNPGTGIYTKPYPDVISDTTIESTVHNGEIADIETDLNTPRPIVAGGTGANNAAGARSNLGAERAMQTVTNYDTHVWENGSFWSAAGATAAPYAGIFSGICYIANNDPNVITVEARDAATGVNNVRQKLGGVWGAWVSEAATYVNTTGDTMTGDLIISKTSPQLTLNKTSASHAFIVSSNTGVTRWAINMAINGANDDFAISRYDDAGNFIDNALSIRRSDGHTIVQGIMAASTPTVGTLHFGTSGTKYIQYDGANFIANGGVFYANQGLSTLGALSVNGAITTNSNINAQGNIVCVGAMDPTNSYKGRAGAGGASANVFNIHWIGAPNLWIDTTNVGQLAFVSDYRTKKDVVDLPSTWDTVKALRPIKYTQAQFSSPSHIKYVAEETLKARKEAEDNPKAEPREVNAGPLFAADNVERWGFIAHELQATLTESAATGVKDSPDTVQSPNPFTLIAALTKALQEAMARIEALEAAQATP
jgi:hypothetical protein